MQSMSKAEVYSAPPGEVCLTGAASSVLHHVTRISWSNTQQIPAHRTMGAYTVSDHIIQNPASVSITMTVPVEDMHILDALYRNREITSLITPYRVLSQCVISDLQVVEGTSIDTYAVTLKVQELMTASVNSASESLEIVRAKSAAAVQAGTAESPTKASAGDAQHAVVIDLRHAVSEFAG